jgi:Clp amino terminal domain, pathogenicity island component
VDLGSVAVIALVAGLAGGAVGAALVGTVEAMLRQRTARARSLHLPVSPNWSLRTSHVYVAQAARPFDDLSAGAKRILALANDEARRFNHAYIGPEHLLIGLSRDSEGVPARVLESLGATLPKLRTGVESLIGRGQTTVEKIDLSDTARSVISKARYEAHALQHPHILPEHLLLGLIRAGGMPMSLLRSLDVDPERIRGEVIAVLGQQKP